MKIEKMILALVVFSVFLVASVSSTALADGRRYHEFSVHQYALDADPGEDPHIHTDPSPSIVTLNSNDVDGLNRGCKVENILYGEDNENKREKENDIHRGWCDWQLNLRVFVMNLF